MEKQFGTNATAFGKITPEILKAQSAAEKFQSSLKRIGEIAAGVGAGELLAKGFEKALGFAERIADTVKEFGVHSLEVRADREVLQNQQHAMLASMGRSDMGPELDAMFRNMEGRESSIKYKQLLSTSNLLMSSAPQQFGNVESMHKMLGQLADVSKDSATFDLATHSITRILDEGKVDAQHLNELSVDTGYSFKKAMADALKVTPEELSTMIKKHTISGEKQIEALLGAFDKITGPGGGAYHHALAQIDGLKGLQAQFEGHWEDFEESFGRQLENFIVPIGKKILQYLTPAALTNAFNGLEYISRTAGTIVSEVTGLVGTRVPLMLGSFQTGFRGFEKFLNSMLVEVNDPVSGIHRIVRPSVLSELNDRLNKMGDAFQRLNTQLGSIVGSPIWATLANLNEKIFQPIDNFLYGTLLGFFTNTLASAINNLMKIVNPFAGPNSAYTGQGSGVTAAQDRLNALINSAASDAQITQAKNDLLAAEKAQRDSQDKNKQALDDATTAAINFAATMNLIGGSRMSPTGNVSGLPDYGPNSAGYKTYEEYGWEGHSSNYGPNGNYLPADTGRYVGLGVNLQRKYHAPIGGKVKINGKVYDVNETSSRDHGVEFKTAHPESVPDRVKVEPVTYNTHYHIQVLDGTGVDRVLNDHADRIEKHLARVRRNNSSFSAVV